MTWYRFFLFLHILTAMLAFGTAMLAFPFIGAFASKEPPHVNFALRLTHRLARKGTIPIGLTVFGLGIVLIIVGEWNLLANEWLLIAIPLFVILFMNVLMVSLPTVAQLIELTSAPPPAGAAGGGPPPHVAKLVRRAKAAGMANGAMIAVIVLLMVWKPGACFGPGC